MFRFIFISFNRKIKCIHLFHRACSACKCHLCRNKKVETINRVQKQGNGKRVCTFYTNQHKTMTTQCSIVECLFSMQAKLIVHTSDSVHWHSVFCIQLLKHTNSIGFILNTNERRKKNGKIHDENVTHKLIKIVQFIK